MLKVLNRQNLHSIAGLFFNAAIKIEFLSPVNLNVGKVANS